MNKSKDEVLKEIKNLSDINPYCLDTNLKDVVMLVNTIQKIHKLCKGIKGIKGIKEVGDE